MKRYFLFTICCTFLSGVAFSQTDEVSFIHGLGDNTTVWNPIANQLGGDFNFNRFDVAYNTSSAISTSADNIYIPIGSVAVGHSLGGVLAREYLRKNGTNKLKALITVGSPHKGAPVAEAVQGGAVGAVIGAWTEDLAAGPAIFLGSIGGRDFARYLLNYIGYVNISTGSTINAYLQQIFRYQASVEDLKPSSQFMSTLNNLPDNTLPSSRFAIYGVEDGPEYVRIAESATKSRTNPIENRYFVRLHKKIVVFYIAMTTYYAALSGKYFHKYTTSDPYNDPNHFEYYNRAIFFAQVSQQWFRGVASLIYYQQRDWDRHVIGVNYYSGSVCGSYQNCKDANDGLLPATTQAPSFFALINDNRLAAMGANHLEQTAHPSVYERIAEVFRTPQVDIEEIATGGGGGPSPGPSPDPCPADNQDPEVVCDKTEPKQ